MLQALEALFLAPPWPWLLPVARSLGDPEGDGVALHARSPSPLLSSSTGPAEQGC